MQPRCLKEQLAYHPRSAKCSSLAALGRSPWTVGRAAIVLVVAELIQQAGKQRRQLKRFLTEPLRRLSQRLGRGVAMRAAERSLDVVGGLLDQASDKSAGSVTDI